MAFVNDCSCPCPSGELDLFEVPATQTSIESASYSEYHPIASLNDASSIEFYVDGTGESYIDLKNSYLLIKARVTNSNGTALADDDKVAPVNLFLHSLFNQVDMYLNGTQISSSSDTYAYRAFMESLLSYGDEAKKTQLAASLFYKDEAGKMDSVSAAADGNDGFKKRQALAAKSANIEMMGRLHCDLFFQDRYLINNVSVKIVLNRSKDAFCLIGEHLRKVQIVSARMLIRKIRVAPSVALGHAKALEIETAKYPLNRVSVKAFTVPSALRDVVAEKLFTGQLPSRIVVGLVQNDAFSGAIGKNPFNFEHFKLSEIALFLDGQTDSVRALKPNYEKKEYVESYLSLFTGTNKINSSEGNSIRISEYPNGYCLYVFDLTPDLSEGSHYSLVRQGNVRLSLKFAEPLDHAATVIAYAEYESVLQIDKARNVIFER